MKIINYSFSLILLLLFVVGCGGNVSVTGKVTFPDGTPLDWGQVVFETSTMFAFGDIQKDGTYTMYTGELKGVPKGTYTVRFDRFDDTIIPPADPNSYAMPTRIPAVVPIARKYLNSETSGLTCEVKGRTTFDITVEKP